ncbi:MAG: hypothetical protein ACYCTI_04585 [Acidimicrobiales bacterium]
MPVFSPGDDDPNRCDWLRRQAVEALTEAGSLLTTEPITPVLASHGWNLDFARGLGQECWRLRDLVARRALTRTVGGYTDMGLVRWMLDMVSPLEADRDLLSDAVQRASEWLRTYIAECLTGPAG